jgi:hypothetical protein
MSTIDEEHVRRMLTFAQKKQEEKESLLHRAYCAGWDNAIVWTRTTGPDAQGNIIFSRGWKLFLERELGDE